MTRRNTNPKHRVVCCIYCGRDTNDYLRVCDQCQAPEPVEETVVLAKGNHRRLGLEDDYSEESDPDSGAIDESGLSERDWQDHFRRHPDQRPAE